MSSTTSLPLTTRALSARCCQDQLILEVEFIKERRGVARFRGVAKVDGEIACEADMMCARRREA